jgi:hypothetical protein
VREVNLATIGPALAALAAVALVGLSVRLLRAPSVYLLALHVVSRVVLDSAPAVTYKPVAAGLSLMQLYSVAFIGLAGLHLLLQRRLNVHRYTLPIAAIVATAALSTFIHKSYLPMATLTLRWLYLWVLIALTLSVLEQGGARRLLTALAVGGVYAFLNIVYSVVTDQPKWGAGQWSYVGTYFHESDVSFLMIMLIIPGLYLLIQRGGGLRPLVGLLCIGAAHIGLAYAAYRSLWVATAGFWAFFIWTRYLHGDITRRAAWMFASVVGVALGTVLIGPGAFEKMSDLGDFAANPSLYLDFSGDAKPVYLMSGRIDLINSYMGIYLNSGVHVWAAGIGPGEGADWVGLYAHNEYLSALVETGAFGFVALLWFLGRYLRDSVKVARVSDPGAQAMAPFLMVIVVSSMGTMPFQDMRAMLTLGIALGFVTHFTAAHRSADVSRNAGVFVRPRLLELTPAKVLR